MERTRNLVVRSISGDPETFGIGLYFEVEEDPGHFNLYYYAIEQLGPSPHPPDWPYEVTLHDRDGDEVASFEAYRSLEEALKFVMESHEDIVGDIFGR